MASIYEFFFNTESLNERAIHLKLRCSLSLTFNFAKIMYYEKIQRIKVNGTLKKSKERKPIILNYNDLLILSS